MSAPNCFAYGISQLVAAAEAGIKPLAGKVVRCQAHVQRVIQS